MLHESEKGEGFVSEERASGTEREREEERETKIERKSARARERETHTQRLRVCERDREWYTLAKNYAAMIKLLMCVCDCVYMRDRKGGGGGGYRRPMLGKLHCC
jgi:hypothetical protein